MVNALFSFPMNLCSYNVGCRNTELFSALTKKKLLQKKNHLCFSLTHNKIISLTGAKSITKAMKKVASGPQRDEGTKWFSELSDKGLSITIFLCPFP